MPASSRVGSGRRVRTSLLSSVTLTLLVLTACAAEPSEVADTTASLPEVSIDGFADVTAELDFDTGTAVTPISEYLVNADFQTEVLFAQARETLVTRCMTSAGHPYNGLTATDWDAVTPQENRIFGRWDVASAAALGAMMDETRGVPKTTFVDRGVDFNNDLNGCNAEAASDAVLGPLSESLSELTLADRILGNAATLAERSEAGKAATERFTACMAKKGIVLDPASGYMSGEYSDLGKSAEIAAAVGEAECNSDTDRIRELFDLSAQYEAAYIAQYEAQLDSVLVHKQQVHEQLQGIINGAS